MAHTITIYTTENCPYCIQAKKILEQKGAHYTEIRVDLDLKKREEMLARSNGQRTVPQIFIDNKHIGGCDDLTALARSGELDKLLL